MGNLLQLLGADDLANSDRKLLLLNNTERRYIYVLNNLDGSGGGDPFTSVYCSINPIRFTFHSTTKLTYLPHMQTTITLAAAVVE